MSWVSLLEFMELAVLAIHIAGAHGVGTAFVKAERIWQAALPNERWAQFPSANNVVQRAALVQEHLVFAEWQPEEAISR